MQANGLFEYRDQVFDAFKDGTFFSEHLEKSHAAACDYVLKDVNNFIQEIKSMQEKINFFLRILLDHHHQLIKQKSLLILGMQKKTKEL